MVVVLAYRRIFNLTYDAQRRGYKRRLGRAYLIVGGAFYRQRSAVVYQPFGAEWIYAIFIERGRIFDESFGFVLDYLPYRGRNFLYF